MNDTLEMYSGRVIYPVYNNSGIAIPDCSFAEIEGYNLADKAFYIKRPSADDLDRSKVLIIPEAIPIADFGFGIAPDVGVVKKSGAVVAGNLVGTEASSWLGKQSDTGLFETITVVNTDYLVIKMQDAGADGEGEVHKAFCKNDAGAATTIICYLDTDPTGEEITVNCSIAGGGNLNEAFPGLADGTLIFVNKIGGTWYCNTVFQARIPCDCVVA